MTPVPPLLGSLSDLADAVNLIANRHQLDHWQRVAAIEILGQVVSDGETSHTEAVRRVANVIEMDPDRLQDMADAARNRASARTSAGNQTKEPAAPQERLPW